jgi:hypothetical protein
MANEQFGPCVTLTECIFGLVEWKWRLLEVLTKKTRLIIARNKGFPVIIAPRTCPDHSL